MRKKIIAKELTNQFRASRTPTNRLIKISQIKLQMKNYKILVNRKMRVLSLCLIINKKKILMKINQAIIKTKIYLFQKEMKIKKVATIVINQF